MSLDTTDELLELARRHGLRLRRETAGLDESGMDFRALHAVDEAGVAWIVRTPRRADVVEAAQVEGRILNLVRTRLSVGVPEWQVHSEQLIAYPRLEGEQAAVLDPEAVQYAWVPDLTPSPNPFIDSLANAMAALHRIPLGVATAAGLRVQQIEEVREELARDMDRTRDLLLVPPSLWRRWQTWLADGTYWPVQPALIHGDLHPGHILVGPDHRVCGLLDWTESRVTDPAIDFAMCSFILEAPVFSALLEQYERAGGPVWPQLEEHAAEWWAAYPVAIALFVLKSGNEEPLALARALMEESDRS